MSRPNEHSPRIDSYAFGRITVGGQTHTADLIILPDRLLTNWWRHEGHSLSAADLDAVFEAVPEVLIVGTGAHGILDVPQATREALAAAGIRLVAERSDAACQAYNRLRGDQRVALAIHLTC